MKKSSRFISIVLILSMAWVFASCQGTTSTTTSAPTTEVSPSSASSPVTGGIISTTSPDASSQISSPESSVSVEPVGKEQMLQLVPDKKDLPSEEVMDVLWSYGGIARTLETVYELAGNPQRVETRDMPLYSDLTTMTVVPTQVYEYDTASGIVYYICYNDDGWIFGLFKGDEWIAGLEKLCQGQS